MKEPPDNVRTEGRDFLGGSLPSPGVPAWRRRMGQRPSPETHQDGRQLLAAPHVQVEGQAVGQGSAQQQDEDEEDAEVGRGEICRPREMCLWPGSWESTATLRSHSLAQVIP